MKKGLILVNAYSTSEHSLNQSGRLKYELEKLGVQVDIERNNSFIAIVKENGEIDSRAEGYDFCIYLDKDKYVSSMLEKCGMRLFNSHYAVEVCDDKMVTYIELSNRNIPMPETLPGLLCYDPQEEISAETLNRIEAHLGYPLIVKASYGSLGSGVHKADNRMQLSKIAKELQCKSHLFQQFIETSFGRDIRVIVIGGKFTAAMIRQSSGDFRSNLELGGVGTPVIPPDEVIEMCENTANILKLDYCGIDVLFGENKYYICEVNSNAFFGGIEKVTGVNVAETYAKYIFETIYNKSK